MCCCLATEFLLIEAPFPASYLKLVHLRTIYKIKQLRYVNTVASYSQNLQMNIVQVCVYVIEMH